MHLEIVKNKPEIVLLKVVFHDEIDRLSTAGFNGDEKFISITKGQDHTITVYYKNSQCSFSFGESDTTLISDNLKRLKQKVLNFLIKSHIQIENETTHLETALTIMYWPCQKDKARTYCVHLGHRYAGYFNTLDDIIKTFGKYEVQDHYTAKTGVKVIETRLI